jgi:glycosyltransferase 2 family protein
MVQPSQPRSWRGAVLRLCGSLTILALLFYFLRFERLWAALRRVPLELWVVVLGGYMLTHVVGVIKWRLLVNLGGAELSFAQATRCYFSGLFSTIFLPSIVGGDIVRMGLALRLARNRAGALLGGVLDRLLDTTALACVAAVGALLLPGTLDARSRQIFWGVTVVLVLAVVTLLAAFVLTPARRFSHKMRRRFVRLRQAARSMSRRPQYVLLAQALGLAVQTSLVLLTTVIAAACGLHVPLHVWLFAWPLAKLSALLPLTQAGIGLRAMALAALAAPFGAAPVLTVAVGLVWEAILIAGALVAGLTSAVLGHYAATRGLAEISCAPAEE